MSWPVGLHVATLGSLVLLVSGVDYQTELNDYYIYTISTGWAARRDFWEMSDACGGRAGWPVTYASQQEYEHILNWMQSQEELRYVNIWIGLTSYKRERFEWVDSRLVVEPFVSELWADPDDSDRGKKCVIQEPGGLLRKCHCAAEQAYMVCKIPTSGVSLPPVHFPQGPCPLGYTKAVDEPDKCFKVVTLNHETGLTFEQARASCRHDGVMAELASIETTNNHQIAELLSLMYERVTGYWVGLTRPEPGGGWQWDDNSPTGVPSAGYYSDACAQFVFMDTAAGKPGDIRSTNCKVKKGYICQTAAEEEGTHLSTTPAPISSCPADYTFYHEACYKTLPANYTWEIADNTCREHLVAIHSINENAFVQMAALALGRPVWIGLYKFGNTQNKWSNKWEVDYTNFASYSRTCYSGKCCTYMKPDGQWYTGACDQQYPAVCEIPLGDPVVLPENVEGLCSSKTDLKWDIDTAGSKCYSVNAATRWTWLEAMEQCLKANSKATLASVPSPAVNSKLVEAFNQAGSDVDSGVWLGLFRDKHGSFRWLDGSPLLFTNWLPGRPTNATSRGCARAEVGGKDKYSWTDVDCFGTSGYACAMDKDLVPATPPPPTSDSCPDDTWDHYGDDCFLFAANTEERFDRAQAACRKYQGAELASVHNDDENHFIRWKLHKRNQHAMHEAFWLGLVVKAIGDVDDVDPEDVEIMWQDSSPYDYSHFYRNEPRLSKYDDQCVVMDTEHGLWITEPCELIRGFVCRLNKGVYHNRGEMSGSELAGVLVGVVLMTLALTLALFVGAAWCLKTRNRRFTGVWYLKTRHRRLTGLPLGFENALYDLVDN